MPQHNVIPAERMFTNCTGVHFVFTHSVVHSSYVIWSNGDGGGCVECCGVGVSGTGGWKGSGKRSGASGVLDTHYWSIVVVVAVAMMVATHHWSVVVRLWKR